MDKPVGGLDQAGIGEAGLAVGGVFDHLFFVPAVALIVGEVERKLVTAIVDIIPKIEPFPIFHGINFDTCLVGNICLFCRRPRFPLIFGSAYLYTGRGIATVAQVGHDFTASPNGQGWLDWSPANDGKAGTPGGTIVV